VRARLITLSRRSPAADVKPDIKSEGLSIKLRDAQGVETLFKIKKTTKCARCPAGRASPPPSALWRLRAHSHRPPPLFARRFSRVIDAYAQRAGVDAATIRLVHDGDRVDGACGGDGGGGGGSAPHASSLSPPPLSSLDLVAANETPEDYDLVDNDLLEVQLAQSGGAWA